MTDEAPVLKRSYRLFCMNSQYGCMTHARIKA